MILALLAAFQQAPYPLDPDDAAVGRLVADARFADPLRDHKALVVMLDDPTCPVVKRYGPARERLQRDYAARGVAFLYISPDAAGPLGARTSADTFVLDAARTLVYRGPIDDQYGIGYQRDAPRESYLADALEDLLAGRPVARPALWAPGCVLELPKSAPTDVTYHNRISRILDRHCVECHRRGGLAPFHLETIDNVRSKKGMIRFVLERGTMPPWFAAEGSGPWKNDRSLPADDRRDLLAWLDETAEGDPADAPLPTPRPDGWTIGEPDAVYELPHEVRVKAEGTMPYVNVSVKTDLAEERWVRAYETRPTARDVVHHVLVFVETEDGRLVQDGERGGFFAAYVPGNGARSYPDGLAKRLPAGATLHFQIHYTPNGTATRDRTRLGLVFGDAPEHEVLTTGILDKKFEIPPREPNHEVTAQIRVPFSARLLSLMPHMHYRGKAFRFDVRPPEGEFASILDVPRYDFNWQLSYDFAAPPLVERGSRLRVTGWFDNSADNPANPDPDRAVTWGLQSEDEMLLGYVEFYREP